MKRTILLVGDSILDNRAYTDKPTGLLLTKAGETGGFEVIDNAVEETQTKHFDEKYRTVGDMWYSRAANRYAYHSKKVQFYPNHNISHIYLSVGGNDIILEPNDEHILEAIFSDKPSNKLGEVIASRILRVLHEYKKRYPFAYIYYILPYKLDSNMVKSLLTRLHITPTQSQVQLAKQILNKTIDFAEEVISKQFHILRTDWKKGDIRISNMYSRLQMIRITYIVCHGLGNHFVTNYNSKHNSSRG